MRVRYAGLAGYTVAPEGMAAFEPVPGEVYDLPAEVVATFGDDFAAEDAFDPVTAKKADLIAHAEGLGLDVDKSAPVADLRDAVTAALAAPAPAVSDSPTGQEG